MALQIRRGTNAERLGITLVEGEVVYVTDFELATITVTSINATTNVLTTTLNHGLTVNQKIKFQGTTGNGLTKNQVYFVKTIPSQVEFTLSTMQGGTTLDITGTATSLVFATGPTDATGIPYGYSISPLYVGDGVTAGGNPAGASILDDLYDVSIGVYGNVGQYGEALANNNVFQYNESTQQWENRADLTLNGNAYINGDNLYINYDANAVDSRIYFQGTAGEIKYDNADQRFELNKDLLATGLQGGNVQIGIGNDSQIYIGGNNLQIDTQAGYHISSNAEFRTTADAIYINSDNTNTPSTLYFKGANNYIRLNTATGYFEFSDNLAKQNLLLSADGTQATITSSAGPLNLNTPSGQSVNVQRDLVVGGNLTVNGTTTTVNSTTLTVDDKNIELAATATPSDTTADGGGITLKGSTDKKIFWQNSDDRWYFDNGDGNNYRIPAFLDDLAEVTITGANKGDLLYHTGSGWVNSNIIEFDTNAYRTRFQSNNTTSGTISSGLLAIKNTGATTNATGDGSGLLVGVLDNTSAIPKVFAAYSGVYNSGGNNELRLRTSTDNFATNDLTVASFNSTDVKFDGTNLILNANNTGAAGDVAIIVERGSSGADANITWSEAATAWVTTNGLVGGAYVATNGLDVVINNDNSSLGSSDRARLLVKRGSPAQADVALRWNENTDRWETTIDGTNYINIPNQALDTGNSPSFAGVTGGNIRIGVTTDNQIDTTSGDLTLDAPTVIVNGSLSVTGSTTLGNGISDTVTITSGTVNIGTTLTSTITIGDAAADTLAVNATSTFNNNLTVGSDSTDTMTVNATANFNNNVTVGSSSTDILTVNAAADLLNDVSLAEGPGNNTVTIGSTNLDEMYVYATTYINNDLDIGSTSGDTVSVNSQVDTDIQFKNITGTPRGVRGTVGDNDTWFVGGFAASNNNGQLIIATADDGTEPIYVRQYSGTILSGTVAKELTLLDASGNTSIPNTLTVDGGTLYVDSVNNRVGVNTITPGTDFQVGGNIWANSIVAINGDLGTNGDNIYFNYDNSGAGADSYLTVRRGTNANVHVRWLESTDRWQTTTDGTNYLNIPNQNLDTTDSVNFGQVTVDALTTFNTESTSNIAAGATQNISSTSRISQKVVIKITEDTTGEIHMLEALAFRKGTTAYLTTYAEMYTNTALATFTADVSGGNIRILATSLSANTLDVSVARISLD